MYSWKRLHLSANRDDLCGSGSSVGIATGYGLDGSGIESRWGRDFPHLSRPALGPNQSSVQWVPCLSPGVKSGRGVTLTPHPLLAPWSWKGRAISLHPLWAVRPVQSLSACTRVHFTLSFYGQFSFTDTVGVTVSVSWRPNSSYWKTLASERRRPE